MYVSLFSATSDVISSSLHSRLVYKRERLKGYTILVWVRGSMGKVTYQTTKHNVMKYNAIANQTKRDGDMRAVVVTQIFLRDKSKQPKI